MDASRPEAAIHRYFSESAFLCAERLNHHVYHIRTELVSAS